MKNTWLDAAEARRREAARLNCVAAPEQIGAQIEEVQRYVDMAARYVQHVAVGMKRTASDVDQLSNTVRNNPTTGW